jgi:hypothetical protein
MDSRKLLDHIFGLREDVLHYLEAKATFYGLTAFEKAVRLLTTFLGNSIIMVFLLISMMFLSGAAALYIGSLLNSTEAGLLIVGGFFFFLALVLMLFRNRIFGPYVIKSLASVFFKDDKEQSKKTSS